VDGVRDVQSRCTYGRCKNMEVALDCHVRCCGQDWTELDAVGSASFLNERSRLISVFPIRALNLTSGQPPPPRRRQSVRLVHGRKAPRRRVVVTNYPRSPHADPSQRALTNVLASRQTRGAAVRTCPPYCDPAQQPRICRDADYHPCFALRQNTLLRLLPKVHQRLTPRAHNLRKNCVLGPCMVKCPRGRANAPRLHPQHAC